MVEGTGRNKVDQDGGKRPRGKKKACGFFNFLEGRNARRDREEPRTLSCREGMGYEDEDGGRVGHLLFTIRRSEKRTVPPGK